MKSNDATPNLLTESLGGILLVAAAIIAMLVKNSPASEWYHAFLNIQGIVKFGAIGVEKPLFLWVNDGLMAIFFFMVGLEIKRELLYGHLKDKSQLVLPVAGAIGGVVVPALIYVLLNYKDSHALVGWAVPTATDIAFALGVLTLLGSKAPASLKIFLMTLAILDDLMAIIIIALFYTSNLSVESLYVASVFLLGLIVCHRLKIQNPGVFIVLGMALWLCVLKSGVHATLAGVITAFFIPAKRTSDGVSSLETILRAIHPWVAFGIVPLFAFANAGISFSGLNLSQILNPIPLGIALGLFVGKPLGVALFSGAVVVFRFARLPEGVSWQQFMGIAFLCGVGFTMSLFIGGLAFAEGGAGYGRIDRLGMLVGSLASALAGFLILYWSKSPSRSK